MIIGFGSNVVVYKDAAVVLEGTLRGLRRMTANPSSNHLALVMVVVVQSMYDQNDAVVAALNKHSPCCPLLLLC